MHTGHLSKNAELDNHSDRYAAAVERTQVLHHLVLALATGADFLRARNNPSPAG